VLSEQKFSHNTEFKLFFIEALTSFVFLKKIQKFCKKISLFSDKDPFKISLISLEIKSGETL